MEVLFVDNADDAVYRLLVNGQTGEACFNEQLSDVLCFHVYLNGFHIYTRGEDIDAFEVVKLNDVVNELAFVFVDAAVLFRFFNDGQKLAFRDRAVGRDLKELVYGLFDGDQQDVDGFENKIKYVDDRRGEHGKALGGFLRDALRGDFTADQNDNGHDDGGDGSAVVREPFYENNGCKRSSADVYDVVADQDG